MLPPLPELNSGYLIERLAQAGSATAPWLVAPFVAGVSCCCSPKGLIGFGSSATGATPRSSETRLWTMYVFGSVALLALVTAIVATSANTAAATRMRI
jgi:hypothetical protein